MGIKLKSIVLIFLGVTFMTTGIYMKAAENTWDEPITTLKSVPGTKGRNAAIGATAGAVGGGILAAVVGGIGIVVAGTGFGLPAGAALIATAATLGAGAGAVGGAAIGKSETAAPFTNIITHTDPAYETWQWASVIAVAIAFLLFAVLEMRKLRTRGTE